MGGRLLMWVVRRAVALVAVMVVLLTTGAAVGRAAAVPGAPTGLKATPGSGMAVLDFTAPAVVSGVQVTNYAYSTDDGKSWLALTPAVVAPPLTIAARSDDPAAPLVDGSTYKVRVRALSSSGDGAASAAVSVTPAMASDTSTGRRYVPLSPSRLADTRPGFAPADGAGPPTGLVGPGGVITVKVAGRAGIPADGVAAVAVNVTATGPTANTFVTVFPAGETRPTASNLNVAAGQTVPNMAVAKLGAEGSISLYNDKGQTHLIVDVLGWFPAGSEFKGLSPARLADTRPGFAPADGQGPRTGVVGAGEMIPLRVTGRGGVGADAGAVVLNVTATGPTANTFVTAFPAGQARPTASSLNPAAGQTVPNMVIAKVGTSGTVNLYNDRGSTHVIVDVLGWFPVGSDYDPLNPARLADTRPGFAPSDGQGPPSGVVAAGQSIDVQVAGRAGVPLQGAGAVALNVTATGPTANTFVTAFPSGQARPTASSLNPAAGQTVPNMVIAKVGAGGKVSLYNDRGQTHLIVDVLGWFPDGTLVASDAVLPPANAVTAVKPPDANGQAVMAVKTTDAPVVGESILVQPTTGFPDGYIGRVTAVSPTAGGYQVSTTPGTVWDIYPQASVEVDLDAGVVAMAAFPQAPTVTAMAAAAAPAPITVSAKCKSSATASVSATAQVSLGQLKLDGDGLRPGSAWVEVTLNPYARAAFTAALEGKVGCELVLATQQIPLPAIRVCIPIPVGCIPFWWDHKINAGLDGRLTAEGGIKFTAATEAGGKFGFRAGKDARLISETYFNKPAANLELKVGVNGTAWLHLDYQGAAYGVLGLTAGIGPELELKANALAAGTPAQPWLTLDARIRGELRGLADLKALGRYETKPATLRLPHQGWRLWTIAKNPGPGPTPPPAGGIAVTWGMGDVGELGNGQYGRSVAPVAVDTSGVLNNKTITQISAGSQFSCAVASDGTAACWGTGSSGQLGNGRSGVAYHSPVPVALDTSGVLKGKKIVQISAGDGHACAVTSDGSAACWGWGGYGQLGNGRSGNAYHSSVPVAVDTSGVLKGKKVVQIGAGTYHVCAVTSDGTAACWGFGYSGQLGNGKDGLGMDGEGYHSSVPVAVDTSGVLRGKKVTQISAGYDHSCAVTSDGTAACWGSGHTGELGNGQYENSVAPVAVETSGVPGGKEVIQISAGYRYSCAVTSDGTATCWGLNRYGELGNGQDEGSLVPVAVDTTGVLAGTKVVQVDTGTHHAAAVAGP